MKNLKIALIVAFLSVAMVGLSDNNPYTANKIVKISIEKAQMCPGLSQAICAQVDKSILKPKKQIYSARVVYNQNVYLVTGSYRAWCEFFRCVPKTQPPIYKH